ncbi:MAG: hypothetical protein LBH85_08440 [Treponema sp.]|nr:hypothetical protein [Treponema sp.]
MEPSEKPKWILETPQNANFIYFTGMAEAGIETEAREAAFRYCLSQVAGLYGNLVREDISERSVWSKDSEKTITDMVIFDENISSYIDTVVSGVEAAAYYTEEYYNSNTNRKLFKVWILCRIARKKAEQNIADFAKNISEPYINLLVKHDTANSALLMYGNILASLEQKPLHRTVAYYDSPGGRVNLYNYIDIQLNTLASGITFAGIPSLRVPKNCTLKTNITIDSPFESSGVIDCVIGIYGADTASPLESRKVAASDIFSLELPNLRLNTGSYTVRLELLLTEISPFIRRNPTISFSLEVTPVTAFVVIDILGDNDGIGEAEKNTLVQALQRGIKNSGVPVSLSMEAGEPDGSGFTITLALRKQPPVLPLKSPLTICDVTLAFSWNGSVRESETKQFSEINAVGAVREARKFIEGNEIFFDNVKRTLEQ